MIQKDEVMKWLAAKCEGTPVESEGDGLEWLLQGKLGDLGIAVLKPNSKKYIQIQRLISIDPEHQTIIKTKSRQDQRKFVYNMKRDLILTGVQWQLLFTDDSELNISELRLSDRIFEDGLTQDLFNRCIQIMHDASILFIINVRYMVET